VILFGHDYVVLGMGITLMGFGILGVWIIKKVYSDTWRVLIIGQ
jgi:hypothetical protein